MPGGFMKLAKFLEFWDPLHRRARSRDSFQRVDEKKCEKPLGTRMYPRSVNASR